MMTPLNQLPNPGDLAIVMRRVCCDKQPDARYVDLPVRVSEIYAIDADGTCAYCGYHLSGLVEIAATADGYAFLRANLRRIPPQSELESIDTVTEIERERPRERVAA